MSNMIQIPEMARTTPKFDERQTQPSPYYSLPYSPTYGRDPAAMQQGGYPQPSQLYMGIPNMMIHQPGVPVPINVLMRQPQYVHCPVCSKRDTTVVNKVIGRANHMMGFALLPIGCCCLPYFVDGHKDVEHWCNHCGTHLATWSNASGNKPMVPGIPRVG